ncbi:hypothetical protein AB0L44_38950 [Nonomuraea wenchangensis]|uniref:hypothetical protein n=1 Tax=Nonomuraea wenchangensis TaxID=568860 RepID=UPI00343CBD8B
MEHVRIAAQRLHVRIAVQRLHVRIAVQRLHVRIAAQRPHVSERPCTRLHRPCGDGESPVALEPAPRRHP